MVGAERGREPAILAVFWLAALAVAFFGLDRASQPLAYAALIAAASAAWWRLALLAAGGHLRAAAPGLFALGIAVRLALLATTSPSLSDDLYRYVWEGRLQARGANPYLVAPEDPRAALPGDPIWEGVNHKEVPAAYPPACQLFLRAVAPRVSSILGMRNAFASLELLLLALCALWLRRAGADPGLIVVPALSPLLLSELTVEGHNDALGLALTVAALALLEGRKRAPLLSGVLLGLAIGAKLLPALLLPWFWRRGRAAALTALAVFGLLWLPYLPAGGSPLALFEGVSQYAIRWRHNDSLFAAIAWATAALQGLLRSWDVLPGFATLELQKAAKIPLALCFGAVFWFVARRTPDPKRGFPRLLLALFALAPALHPWYVCWLVPFLAFERRGAGFALAGLVPLAHEPVARWRSAGVWRERLWVKCAEFVPFYALLARDALGARGRKGPE